jgi:D-3-phosphoglycerate dehydrogenase
MPEPPMMPRTALAMNFPSPLSSAIQHGFSTVCLAIANEATENLIGHEALARMQPHAFFINLSHGNLVDEAALTAALRENRLAGAAIDVDRARDQMPTAELANLPNVSPRRISAD